MSDRPTKRDREIPEKRFEDERESIIAWLEKLDDLSSGASAFDALQYIRSLEHRAIDRDTEIEALERQVADAASYLSEDHPFTIFPYRGRWCLRPDAYSDKIQWFDSFVEAIRAARKASQ